jgi:predicted MPP superfamily phosphohydrolase
MSFRIIIVIAIWAIIDLYVFQAIKTVTSGLSSNWIYIIRWGYWIIDIILAIAIIYLINSRKFAIAPSHGSSLLIGLMFISFVPKLIIVPFLLVEDIYRIINAAIHGIIRLFSTNTATHNPLFTERRKFISQISLLIGAIPFMSLIYGMVKGKYNFKVHKVTLAFKDLPEAFHNFTITQVSDIHCGSFDDQHEVIRAVELANAQNSDIFFLTGDLVNNIAGEIEPWVDVFSKFHAPYGKFSILGNHDYGDYVHWDSKQEKHNNLNKLKELEGKLGFRLLLNENVKIEKEGQYISLIGVENWGKRGFAKYGDLNKSLIGVDDNSFKILLSHDPSHWDAQVLNHDKHIHLTLSGHTHGMQFGVEVPGFKWSPVEYMYPEWAGLYEKFGKYIYVNRGFGFIGYPGRVGIYPEITVIKLVKA